MFYLIIIITQFVILGTIIFFLMINKNQDNIRSRRILRNIFNELQMWESTLNQIILEAENTVQILSSKIDEKLREFKIKIEEEEKKMEELRKILLDQQYLLSSFRVRSDPKEDALIPSPYLSNQKYFSSRYNRVYELFDQGWDVVDIAKETKVGKGEIQLILDLRRGGIHKVYRGLSSLSNLHLLLIPSLLLVHNLRHPNFCKISLGIWKMKKIKLNKRE